MGIRVAIADDHGVVIDGVSMVVERNAEDIEIVYKCNNGKEMLKYAKAAHVDVYILDISMPVLNGIETAMRLSRQRPESGIIILSMHDERSFVEKALTSGVRGYVLKESATEEIIDAIRAVYSGGTFLSDSVAKYLQPGFRGRNSQYAREDKWIDLTRKEREVLQLIAEGSSNREIAETMSLSVNTIHVHRNNIMRKLGIHKQADLIRYAIKEGISAL